MPNNQKNYIDFQATGVFHTDGLGVNPNDSSTSYAVWNDELIDQGLSNMANQNLKQVLKKGNNADGQKIVNLADPENNQDAATKKYVDDNIGGDQQPTIGSPIVRGPFTINYDTPGLVSTPYAITGLNQGQKKVSFAGDHTAEFPQGSFCFITGSTGNDYSGVDRGQYTVDAVAFAAGDTTVTLVEALADNTADGNITPCFTHGVEFYTPTVGDFLLDGWIFVTEVFDGDYPRANIGNFDGTTLGLFTAGAPQVDNARSEEYGNGFSVLGHYSHVNLQSTTVFAAYDQDNGYTPVPGLFTAATPLKAILSQGGEQGQLDPGSTQGSFDIYLVTVTPVV